LPNAVLELSGMLRLLVEPLFWVQNEPEDSGFEHELQEVQQVLEGQSSPDSPLYRVSDVYVHDQKVTLALQARDIAR